MGQRQALEQPDAGAAGLGARRGDEVNKTQPAKAIELEHQSADKLKAIGVKIVTGVDKSGFIAVADPYLDKLAKELGPHAEKVKDLIRAIK